MEISKVEDGRFLRGIFTQLLHVLSSENHSSCKSQRILVRDA